MTRAEAIDYAAQMFIASVNQLLAERAWTEAELEALVPALRTSWGNVLATVDAVAERRGAVVH